MAHNNNISEEDLSKSKKVEDTDIIQGLKKKIDPNEQERIHEIDHDIYSEEEDSEAEFIKNMVNESGFIEENKNKDIIIALEEKIRKEGDAEKRKELKTLVDKYKNEDISDTSESFEKNSRIKAINRFQNGLKLQRKLNNNDDELYPKKLVISYINSLLKDQFFKNFENDFKVDEKDKNNFLNDLDKFSKSNSVGQEDKDEFFKKYNIGSKQEDKNELFGKLTEFVKKNKYSIEKEDKERFLKDFSALAPYELFKKYSSKITENENEEFNKIIKKIKEAQDKVGKNYIDLGKLILSDKYIKFNEDNQNIETEDFAHRADVIELMVIDFLKELKNIQGHDITEEQKAILQDFLHSKNFISEVDKFASLRNFFSKKLISMDLDGDEENYLEKINSFEKIFGSDEKEKKGEKSFKREKYNNAFKECQNRENIEIDEINTQKKECVRRDPLMSDLLSLAKNPLTAVSALSVLMSVLGPVCPLLYIAQLFVTVKLLPLIPKKVDKYEKFNKIIKGEQDSVINEILNKASTPKKGIETNKYDIDKDPLSNLSNASKNYNINKILKKEYNISPKTPPIENEYTLDELGNAIDNNKNYKNIVNNILNFEQNTLSDAQEKDIKKNISDEIKVVAVDTSNKISENLQKQKLATKNNSKILGM